ncbi:hypothetical protein L6452_29420 [Arctium lappa]|uniref:Uncharacterized protein n=1 Tax=Arctium lappa TaxID=4217 RepID=A0ACB8ZHP4_ARCLA|nr:hypothetical protein L6452_29420 [Arctium lappa]
MEMKWEMMYPMKLCELNRHSWLFSLEIKALIKKMVRAARKKRKTFWALLQACVYGFWNFIYFLNINF